MMRFFILLLCCSCLRVTTINIGQKTSLEHQLMGEFQPLSEDQILLSSVRAAYFPNDEKFPEQALQARQRQLFNRDDIDAYKEKHCLGEMFNAQLHVRNCQSPELLKLVAEENSDRQIIINWLVKANDISKIEVTRMYQQNLLEKSKPGTWFETAEGNWQQK